MLAFLIVLMLVVGISVIYLSIEKKQVKPNTDFDWKNTIFAKELEPLEISNSEFLKLYSKLKEYIVGSDNLLKSILVSILSNWHILVEGAPGLAKTRTILVLSKLMGLDFKRIQFTPDMLPADIIWWEIFDKKENKFKVFFWPIFTNLLLADEINRATPKVQSALLEAMQEKQVTIGWQTYKLPEPFFVMATQNPIEQEWTYPLPEAQMDRFFMKVLVEYPSKEEELKILEVFEKSLDDIAPLFTKEQLIELQKQVDNIVVTDEIKDYITNIVEQLRKKDKNILLWPSPRATISLLKASKAVAYLAGDTQVKINYVNMVVLPVLRHRIKLSLDALINNRLVDEVICKKLLSIKK